MLNPVQEDASVYRVADKIVDQHVFGSAEILSIKIYAQQDLLPKGQDPGPPFSWNWEHAQPLGLPDKDLLESCGNGMLIIGQYDFDPAIELSCYDWNVVWNSLSKPLQIWPDGKLQAEQGWLSAWLMRLHANLVNLPALLLSLLMLILGACSLGLYLLHWLVFKAIRLVFRSRDSGAS